MCRRCGGAAGAAGDDNEAVVRERLQVYQRETQPLVEYYRARPTFRVGRTARSRRTRVAADIAAAIGAAATAGARSG